MKKVFFWATLVLVLLLTGCADVSAVFTPSAPSASSTISEAKASIAAEASRSPTSTPTPGSTRTAVVWADYDSGTQAEIDFLTKSHDCRGLNSFTGMATATESAVIAKTGHGNEALLKYINEALALASCY